MIIPQILLTDYTLDCKKQKKNAWKMNIEIL